MKNSCSLLKKSLVLSLMLVLLSLASACGETDKNTAHGTGDMAGTGQATPRPLATPFSDTIRDDL